MPNPDLVPFARTPLTRRRLVGLAGGSLCAALAGCIAGAPTATPTPPEATITVRIRNRDAVDREYEVVVRSGDAVRNEFSGVLPADAEQSVEMVATVRATAAQHEFTVSTANGQVGRTWDPTECGEFVVEAFVENGAPGFDADCRS